MFIFDSLLSVSALTCDVKKILKIVRNKNKTPKNFLDPNILLILIKMFFIFFD